MVRVIRLFLLRSRRDFKFDIILKRENGQLRLFDLSLEFFFVFNKYTWRFYESIRLCRIITKIEISLVTVLKCCRNCLSICIIQPYMRCIRVYEMRWQLFYLERCTLPVNFYWHGDIWISLEPSGASQKYFHLISSRNSFQP